MLHALITLVIGAGLYPLNLHIEGMLMAALFYLGREHAQAEQRVISQHYGNKRANAPWWCGFEYRAWTFKGMLDWVLPLGVFIIASVAV